MKSASNHQNSSFLHPKLELTIRVIVALTILQTLRFKFFAHHDSVALFQQVSQFLSGGNGLEAWLRIGTGVIELIAGICLFCKSTVIYGAILAAFTMIGAVQTHLFIIGINFRNDGGVLFSVGILALLGSLILIYNRRTSIPVIGHRFITY